MRPKPFVSLAYALSAVLLALPACGGDDGPDPAPADDLRVLEQRVGAIERQLRDLRQELRTQGQEKQSSSDQPGNGAAPEDAADGGRASAPDGAPGDTRGASVSGPDPGGGGSGSGGGAGSGSGGGGSGGGSDSGSGPDPGTSEDDRSLEEICGPNPAPEC